MIKKIIKKKYKTIIIIGKTIRSNYYLAFSSRNNLLNNKNLAKATAISRKIRYFKLLINKKFINIKKLNNIKNDIKNIGGKIEYLEIRNKYNLSKRINKYNYKIFIAYYIDKVRLIDNF